MTVHRATAAFWQQFQELSKEVRGRADKQFALLKADERHPSLHFKPIKMQRGEELWSARVSLYYPALAIRRTDGFLWVWIGDHKAYDILVGRELALGGQRIFSSRVTTRHRRERAC